MVNCITTAVTALMESYKHYPLGIHTNICYCSPLGHYNCSVDWLGMVYPGQTLTVGLCLSYNNEETSILCVETYNDNLPTTACKVYDLIGSKYVFNGSHNQGTIASNHSTMCKLFLTAQPELYAYYDTFIFMSNYFHVH